MTGHGERSHSSTSNIWGWHCAHLTHRFATQSDDGVRTRMPRLGRLGRGDAIGSGFGAAIVVVVVVVASMIVAATASRR